MKYTSTIVIKKEGKWFVAKSVDFWRG